MFDVKPCSRCGEPSVPGQRYCRSCRNAYNRAWFKKNPPPYNEARYARAKAGVYLRRGKLERFPCEVCGAPAQMHHDDYSRPLEVKWLCRAHHLERHSA
jgi:hypothetical protein